MVSTVPEIKRMHTECSTSPTPNDSTPDTEQSTDILPPPAKKRKHAPIVRAKDLKLGENVFIRNIYQTSTKTAKLTFRDGETAPVLVQLNGGNIPRSFGVDENAQFGTTISINVGDPDDQAALDRFQNDIKQHMIENKAEWFVEGTKDVSIEDNMHKLMSAPKPKEKNDPSKGFWSPTMKAYIKPTDMESVNGRSPATKFIDSDGSPIHDIVMLPGRQFDKAIIELSCLYVSGKSACGISRKWRYISLKEDERDFDIVPF
jgi:hypothetical protein